MRTTPSLKKMNCLFKFCCIENTSSEKSSSKASFSFFYTPLKDAAVERVLLFAEVEMVVDLLLDYTPITHNQGLSKT